jgi:hypothetical protein
MHPPCGGCMISCAMPHLVSSRWQPPTMDGPDCFARILGAGSQIGYTCCAISLEEVVIVPNCLPRKLRAFGVVWLWRNSVKSSCARGRGTPSHAPKSRPALMKSISIPTLSRDNRRNKGIEEVAGSAGAPERCVALRSSEDYAARGGSGDPRGRKSGAGPRAANPR